MQDQDSADPGHHSRADRDQRRRSLRHSAGQPAGAGAARGRAKSSKGIEMVHGAPVYRLRGNLLPLVYLNRELQIAAEAGTEDAQATAASTSWCCRPTTGSSGWSSTRSTTPRRSSSSRWASSSRESAPFAGATIMGDGRVALILDVPGPGAARQGDCRSRASASVDGQGRKPAGNEDSAERTDQTLLLFQCGDAGPHGHSAVPGGAAGGVCRRRPSSTPDSRRSCSIADRSCR